MILNRENGQIAVAKSLQRLIIEVEMSQLDLAILERIRVNRKAVVMGRNFNLVC